MSHSRREFLGAVSAASAAGVSRLYGQAPGADLVLFNEKIVTVDDAFSIREAIVIKDGRILAVGGNELRNRYPGARAIDLRGRMVIPGFHDTHIHLGGHSRRYIDLNDTTSLAQLKQQVADKAKELGPGEWITGSGWDEYHFTAHSARRGTGRSPESLTPRRAGLRCALSQWREQRKPLRGDLDAAAPNNPVVLTRAGGHSSVGNSKALQMADINKATPDPERGLIEHDEKGEPNGIIRERSDLYTRLVPKDKPADVRDSLLENVQAHSECVVRVKEDQLKLGITSVIEAGSSVDPNVVGSFAEWELLYRKHGAELPRASVQVGYPSPAGQAQVGAAKLKEFGKKTGDGDDRLRVGSIGEMAADGGFTGPTAWVLEDYKGQPGFRGRAFFTPEQIHANIEAGHQLGWQFGIHAIGDASIVMTPIGPFVGLYAAVTRKGESGKAYGPEEAVSMKDAIKMYTRNGAFLTREEKIKGTLEPGKLADMIVLPEDLLAVPPEKLLTMKVDMTIVGGRILYDRNT
jgi:predicted amidohydrolase YtcJ